jgi:hypothetical protein
MEEDKCQFIIHEGALWRIRREKEQRVRLLEYETGLMIMAISQNYKRLQATKSV